MKLTKLSSLPFILLIRFYRKFLSRLKPKRMRCRFHPTCTRYAIEAIQKYGVIKGLKKTWGRLKRCNPYNRDSCIDYP